MRPLASYKIGPRRLLKRQPGVPDIEPMWVMDIGCGHGVVPIDIARTFSDHVVEPVMFMGSNAVNSETRSTDVLPAIVKAHPSKSHPETAYLHTLQRTFPVPPGRGGDVLKEVSPSCCLLASVRAGYGTTSPRSNWYSSAPPAAAAATECRRPGSTPPAAER